MWPTRVRTSGWSLARRGVARWRTALTAIADAEQGRLVLWLPVFMGTGVLAYYALRAEPPAWIGAKFAAAGFVAAIAAVRCPTLRAIALSIACGSLGFASAQFATSRMPPIEADLPSKASFVTGTVRAVEILPLARRITLAAATIAGEQPTGRGPRAPPALAGAGDRPAGDSGRRLVRTVRIRLKSGDDTAIETGDRVRVRAMLRTPPPPALPDGWDTQRDAFYAGLGASGYALARVEIASRGNPDRLTAWVQRLRETIAARVSAVIPGAAGSVSVTLLTGAARGIPEADHAAFRDSGLAHLLAVAGLHIGIVMGFAFTWSRVLLALSERASLFWPTKKIAALAALAVGGGYMVLTGAHVPIVRSFAMACLVTLAMIAGRQPISVRGLGLAGIAMVLIMPYEVPGVSFQMSFSAVLALIAGYETVRPWRRRLYGAGWSRRLLSHIAALALTSTLAGTASLPYGAYHFGHVQVYYILSNIAAVPLTALWVMPAGMIALVLMPLGLEWLALIPMGWGAALVIWIARFTAALPAATWAVPHMPAWGLATLSLGIAWTGIWRSWIRLLGAIAVAAGIASCAFDRPPDIMISADAGLIAFRSGTAAFLWQTRGGAAFTRDAWLSRWSVTGFSAMPAQGAAASEGAAASGGLSCARDACVFRPRVDGTAALLLRGPVKPDGCADKAVVVSAESARGVCRYPTPRIVDRFTVWKDGPAAIWLDPAGARVLTDRDSRGTRPWVPPPPVPRPPPVSNLPAAKIDRAEP